MDHWYELWDSVGASLIGHYETRDQALRVVRDSLVAHGPGSVVSLVLIHESNEDESEEPEVVAAGSDLMMLVQSGSVPS